MTHSNLSRKFLEYYKWNTKPTPPNKLSKKIFGGKGFRMDGKKIEMIILALTILVQNVSVDCY